LFAKESFPENTNILGQESVYLFPPEDPVELRNLLRPLPLLYSEYCSRQTRKGGPVGQRKWDMGKIADFVSMSG
jgi:hypothetical protein